METSSVLALASGHCAYCLGFGTRGWGSRTNVCDCVYRRVFRACSGKYWELRACEGDLARQVNWERSSYREAKCGLIGGFKAAEFLADFEIVARRALAGDPLEYAVFRYRCLCRLDWKACLQKLPRDLGRRLDRGSFFHAVYRMERKLGRIFLELRPYSLFPCNYFSGHFVERGASYRGCGDASYAEIRKRGRSAHVRAATRSAISAST